MMYAALIGDLVESKKLPDRQYVQEQLKQILAELNQEYSSAVASNLTVTLGDEFQGLFKTPDVLLEIADKIKFRMLPVKVRFGIGFGDITTDITRELSIGADGPAYWHARAAIEAVHDTGGLMIIWDEDSPLQQVVNDSLALCDFVESRWRDSQTALIRESILNFGHSLDVSQVKLAELLGITTQAVNQRVQSTGYYQYLGMKNSITRSLKKEWDK